jgi:hypothetical protein
MSEPYNPFYQDQSNVNTLPTVRENTEWPPLVESNSISYQTTNDEAISHSSTTTTNYTLDTINSLYNSSHIFEASHQNVVAEVPVFSTFQSYGSPSLRYSERRRASYEPTELDTSSQPQYFTSNDGNQSQVPSQYNEVHSSAGTLNAFQNSSSTVTGQEESMGIPLLQPPPGTQMTSNIETNYYNNANASYSHPASTHSSPMVPFRNKSVEVVNFQSVEPTLESYQYEADEHNFQSGTTTNFFVSNVNEVTQDPLLNVQDTYDNIEGKLDPNDSNDSNSQDQPLQLDDNVEGDDGWMQLF